MNSPKKYYSTNALTKKEKKTKLDKNSGIVFLTDINILTKPSDNKKFYSDFPPIKKDQVFNCIEDIIEQKDDIYAKFRKKDNKFYYAKLTNDEGELLVKNIEKIPEKEEKKSQKFSYSTMGQIRVGDETGINLPISTGVSSEYIFHNELIKNAHALFEKTNCFLKNLGSINGTVNEDGLAIDNVVKKEKYPLAEVKKILNKSMF